MSVCRTANDLTFWEPQVCCVMPMAYSIVVERKYGLLGVLMTVVGAAGSKLAQRLLLMNDIAITASSASVMPLMSSTTAGVYGATCALSFR